MINVHVFINVYKYLNLKFKTESLGNVSLNLRFLQVIL